MDEGGNRRYAVVVRVYLEGGDHLRESFGVFFTELREAAREGRAGLRLVAGGATPVQDFFTALRKHPNDHVVLLIDCEGPADDCTVAKLRTKFRSIWKPPSNVQVDADRVFRMTQIMESWFLADRATLQDYYGRSFQESALPGHANPEQAPKADVLARLKEATRRTRKGAYKKGSHAAEILRRLNPSLVQAKAAECERIFKTLTRVLNGA